jgi:hypothetical protein
MSFLVAGIATAFKAVGAVATTISTAATTAAAGIFTAAGIGTGAGTFGSIVSGAIGKGLTGALTGGVISKLGGGSFKDGALMGGLGGLALGAFGGGAGGGGSGGAGAGASGGGAGGAATGGLGGKLGGMLGDGFLGNVLMGAAQGYSTGAQMKERENQDIREEQRRADRYRGSGTAARPWESATDTNPASFSGERSMVGQNTTGSGLAPVQSAEGAPQDQQAQPVSQVANAYIQRAKSSAKRRFQYDPDQGRIVYT